MTSEALVHSIVDARTISWNRRRWISYAQFYESRRNCREQYGELYDICFWPRVFFLFPFVRIKMDGHETRFIEATYLHKYIHEFAILLHMKKELERYAENGKCAFEHIQAYTRRKLRNLYALKTKNRDMVDAACKLAALTFQFHFERRGRYKIEEVVTSDLAWELEKTSRFENLKIQHENDGNNWFGDKITFGILNAFFEVTEDVDGVLTQETFKTMPLFSAFSPSFVDQLFCRWTWIQEKVSTSGEYSMDFEGYSKFILAWSDRTSPAAVKFVFNVFDINDSGYLTVKDLQPFLLETLDLLRTMADAMVYSKMADDILGEIFDIVHPVHPWKITAQDIIRCKRGYDVFGILVDATELYRYECREDMNSDSRDVTV